MPFKKHFHYLLVLFLMIVFPAFVWGVGVVLSVDTIEITNAVTEKEQTPGGVSYRLAVPRPEDGQRYELMFETAGNIIEITAGDQRLYTYGEDIAASGGMIGNTFVHAFLPDAAYEQPLMIRLTKAEANASLELDRIELCPHADSLRYYITNKTLGLPLAVVFISMAFAIPVFLLLGNERRLLYEGMLFGCVLLCSSVLLLSRGGHFLVFFADQRAWSRVYYLAHFLLPTLTLLYFCVQERPAAQRNIMLAAAAVNAVFFLLAAVLGLTETVHFCDFSLPYAILLGMDAVIGAYGLYWNIRQKRMSRVRLLLMMMAVVWAGFIVISNIVAYAFPGAGLPNFDPLEICAVCLFYGLCYLFVESAFRVQRDAENTVLQIEALKKTEQTALSTTEITREMLAYESIYVIDAETGAYTCYYETSAHGDLGVASSGDDFYETMAANIPSVIAEEDRDYVRRMLSREAVLQGTRSQEAYAFMYRVLSENGAAVYHKIRAIRRMIGGKDWILLGVRDIDAAVRREMEHTEQRESMLQKEMNYLEAILASAAGYLEANLSQDIILDRSHNGDLEDRFPKALETEEGLSFSLFMRWWADHMVVENQAQFVEKNSPEYLIRAFERGERRASVSFSARRRNGAPQPCRQVMYLYRDKASDDVMCFHVVYDLTEQQKKEKEMRELEQELRMSRIRVFTGQMQPHFLYNALGSIQEVILYDPEYASELLGDFTIHLRGSIRAMASDDPIPFSQELENIRAYTNIEKMRFGEKLNVVFETEAADFSIAPLSIQPLVENAIRHGIYERGPRGGTATVRSRETAESWIVEVEDDGVGFDVDQVLDAERNGTSASTGLKNVLFRMDKMMRAQVQIHSRIGTGTHIIITLPKGGNKS